MAKYHSIGRTGQKRRTRSALKAAATELILAGEQPTVVQVADAAGISKSTAYRYFPSQELMYAEVMLTATVGTDQQRVYTAAESEGDVSERLDGVIRTDHAFTIKHQLALRTGLRAFLLLLESFPDVPLETSNRVRYLTTALAPVGDQITPAAMRRLVAALSLCVGIEAATITQVNCQLSVEDSEGVKRWAAAALLRAALAEADASQASLACASPASILPIETSTPQRSEALP